MTKMMLAMDPAGMVPYKQGILDVTNLVTKSLRWAELAHSFQDENYYRDRALLHLLERYGARAGVLFYTNQDGDMVVLEEYVR